MTHAQPADLQDHPEVRVWREVALTDSCAALRDAAEQIVEPAAADVSRLRKHWSAEQVHIAFELAAARRKAAGKFPGRTNLIADVAGVEQATSACVAAHKAKRYAEACPDRIVDLCCGIGGDAMALVGAAEVLAVDQHPARAWMAGVNSGCSAVAGDVGALDLSGAVIHLDPARRSAVDGGRRHKWAQYQPGPAVIEQLITANPDAAVKLGPGIDFADLPDRAAAEIEIINERGRLVQAVWWHGRLARHAGQRTATRLPECVSFVGQPGRSIPTGSGEMAARYVFVIDPAVERADLTGTLCAELCTRAMHPLGGLITDADLIESPWLTPFECVWQGPWQEKRVRAWLAGNDAGVVEVKLRGMDVDSDSLQARWRGDGGTSYTVFLRRFGARRVAMIARRI